jgi:hypothetical protein
MFLERMKWTVKWIAIQVLNPNIDNELLDLWNFIKNPGKTYFNKLFADTMNLQRNQELTKPFEWTKNYSLLRFAFDTRKYISKLNRWILFRTIYKSKFFDLAYLF